MDECNAIIKKALQEGRSSLLENEAKRICALHHIPTPPHYLAKSVDEAMGKTDEIGFPIVLKIVSPKIIHKSDVGGVLLNIQDRHELSEAYNRLIGMIEKKIPSEEIVGVLVEKMMPPSTELIIGGLRDPQFGPSLMFGIGGIFTEVYNDVTFRVAPIDRKDAAEMIRELKGSKILEGIRGNPPADQEAIITILVNTSELLYEHEAINQLDLNPVMAYPKGVCAVDARIILKDTKEG